MSKIVKWVTLISLILIIIVFGIYFFIISHTLDKPLVSNVIAGDAGINISWEAVDKAESYAVLKRTDGKWKKIADIDGTTTYIDIDVVPGETYFYTVRCEDIMHNQYLSGYDKEGVCLTYLSTPILNGCSVVRNGINISWENVEGASRYRIFRKEGNGSWNRLADVDNSKAEYVDTTAVNGGKYSYTVRCMSLDGKWYTSGYNTNGMEIILLDLPDVLAVDVEPTGVEIKWKAVEDAAGYRVFRKVNSGDWEIRADITAETTSYVDEDAEYGVEYVYTVRCISEDAKTYTSEYHESDVIVRCEIPTIVFVEEVDNGVEVLWEKVENAERYRVFRKTNDDKKWTILDTVDNSILSYIDETVEQGNTYIYTIRCVNANETHYTSWHSGNGLSIDY